MTLSHPGIRVLLTKPPVGKYPLGYRLYPPMIPMGLGFLARVLQDNGIQYVVADNYLASFGNKTWNKSAYQQILNDFIPTHVCVTSMSVEWPEALDLIRVTRSALPECKVLVGGPHAHFAAGEIAAECDYVVIGEGERALPDLLLNRVIGSHIKGNIIEYPFVQPLDLDRLRCLMVRPVIVDLRNIYRADGMKRAKLRYLTVGRPAAERYAETAMPRRRKTPNAKTIAALAEAL